MPDPTLLQLIDFIRERFDLAELADLCLQLGVDDEDIEGGTLNEKARELVEYMERRGRLPELQEAVARARPKPYAQSFPAPQAVAAELTSPAEPPAPIEKPVAKRIPIWAWVIGTLAVVTLTVWAVIAYNGRTGGEMPETTQPPTVTSTAGASFDPTLVSPVATIATKTNDTPTPIHDAPTPQTGQVRTIMRSNVEVEQVCVPAGSFRMGSQNGVDDQQPVHKVTLGAFWLDRTEVTNAQFAAFVNATGYETTAEGEGRGWIFTSEGAWQNAEGADWKHPRGPGSDIIGLDAHPVVLVSWTDATIYAAWAGGRLPTEAEWEYAARGPHSLVYPWDNEFDGEKLNHCDSNCPFAMANQNADDGYELTAPVGSYLDGASWVGALDMSGNVWEWVNDWYSGDYYAGSPLVDPPGPTIPPPSEQYRVLRGGSWSDNGQRTGAAFRGNNLPANAYNMGGFRVVHPDPDC